MDKPTLKVCVDYFRNIDRVPNLAFARTLMVCFDSPTLYVRALAPAGANAHLASEQVERVRADVATLTGLSIDQVQILDDFPSGCIAVDNFPICSRHDVTWVVPMDERGLTVRGKGNIMVPFGNGVSALKAFALAAPIALSSSLPLVFYHTTWRNSRIDSANPADHICADARLIQGQLEAAARELNIASSTVIECADDVADGILHTAMSQSSRLIIMPQSQMVEVGDYCYRVKDKSPVPVMVIGREVTP